MYSVTKTIPHSAGLSVCFRQHRASSHCRFLHGYALQVEITYESETLDVYNWVIDFGGFKELLGEIRHVFDHKTVVAMDDPHLPVLRELSDLGVCNLVVTKDVSCECFAKLIWGMAVAQMLPEEVNVVKVTVREHGGNSASYTPEA